VSKHEWGLMPECIYAHYGLRDVGEGSGYQTYLLKARLKPFEGSSEYILATPKTAAAPEMLEALNAMKQAWAHCDVKGGFADQMILGTAFEKIDKAIEKAEGKS
jgi:hypothetical protein